MVNATRSPALHACTFSAFVIPGTDMEVFPLVGVPVFGRQEILAREKVPFLPSVMFQPSEVPTTAMYCSTALTGHVVTLPNWKLKRKPHSFGSRNIRCMSERLNSSPRFVVLNATHSGEIKNEFFFYERGPKSYFLKHLADSARRRLKRKLLSTRSRVIKKKKMYNVPIKSYSGFKNTSKWSVLLLGIDFSPEKNAIFAVTGSGIGR